MDAHPDWNWKGWWHLETLDISKNYFLCMSVDEQINVIIEFIERTSINFSKLIALADVEDV